MSSHDGSDELLVQARALGVVVGKLAGAVSDLSDRMAAAEATALRYAEQLAAANARVSRNRMLTVFTLAGLVLDLVLSGGMILFAQQLQHEITDQAVVRHQVLCPLFDLFVGSYHPDSPEALRDPAAYERAFVRIRESYAVLACDQP